MLLSKRMSERIDCIFAYNSDTVIILSNFVKENIVTNGGIMDVKLFRVVIKHFIITGT